MGTPGQETVAHAAGKDGANPCWGQQGQPWFSFSCTGHGERGGRAGERGGSPGEPLERRCRRQIGASP